MPSIQEMIACYGKHKSLKIAAEELGIKFQTLYWHLTKAGVNVTGDKERYGTDKDKLAARAEKLFSGIVPFAHDKNKMKYQSKIDFTVSDIKIDVKASKRQSLGVGKGGDRWAFSIKKQLVEADFFVMFALDQCPSLDDTKVEKIFLIPAGLIASLTSISISANGKSKWHAYEVSRDELHNFFQELR